MNKPRDSEDETVEQEEAVAGQSDTRASDKGSERYGFDIPVGQGDSQGKEMLFLTAEE